jgi:hypothetical protein
MYVYLAQDLIGLQKINDPDVKKNALEGLTTIVHNFWNNLKTLVDPMQEFAYGQTR